MRHAFTLLCLLAAIAAYGLAGSARGTVFFLGLGIVLEGTFWYRLFRRKEKN
jgi:hypothetical protein